MSPSLSSTLGVKSDPGKGNLFPAAPPSDSGQGGRASRGREREEQLPQLLKGHESAQRRRDWPAIKTPCEPFILWARLSLQSPLRVHFLPLPLPLKRARQRTPVPLGPRISGNGSLSHSIPKGSLLNPWLPPIGVTTHPSLRGLSAPSRPSASFL